MLYIIKNTWLQFILFHLKRDVEVISFSGKKNINQVYKDIYYQFKNNNCVFKGCGNPYNLFRPIGRPSHDLRGSNVPVHVPCYPIVLLCAYVLKVMLSKCVLAIILPQ